MVEGSRKVRGEKKQNKPRGQKVSFDLDWAVDAACYTALASLFNGDKNGRQSMNQVASLGRPLFSSADMIVMIVDLVPLLHLEEGGEEQRRIPPISV